MPSANFLRSNILITSLSLIAVGITFISQMALAYYFGAEAERDSYFAAMTVPAYIVTLFVGSLSVVFLPFYVDFRKKHDDAEIIRFVSSTFGMSVLFLIIITIGGFIFSETILNWIAPGFSEPQLAFTNRLFRILVLTILFQSLSSLITVFHHVKQRFLWPALSPIIIPFTGLFFVVVFHDYGIISLAVGTLSGSILAMIILLPPVLKKISFAHLANFQDPNLVTVVKLAMPLLTASAIYRLTTIMERLMASRLPAGSISYLGYSNQLYVAMAAIATGSIATTFYPVMSSAWSDGQRVEFSALLSKGIKLIVLITFPMAAIIIVLSPQIIEILFQRGAFDSTATQAVSTCLTLLMGAFIFGSLGNLLIKVFYITNKTLTISVVCILEVIVYGITGYLLSSFYSYPGLAFALTVSTGITIAVLIILLVRWNYLSVAHLYPDLIKLLISGIVCGLIARLIFLLFGGFEALLATAVSAVAGVISYLLMITYVLKISDRAVIYNAVKSYF